MSMGNAGGGVNSEISQLLVQGFKAAKENHKEEAYNIFCDVVRRDPGNELGWLYRAATTDDLSEAYVCLQRVLSINPSNEKAQRGIERIQSRLNTEEEAGSAAAASAVPQGRVGEDTVVSGFNRVPGANPVGEERRGIYDTQPSTPPGPADQSTARYNYQYEEQPARPAPPVYQPNFGSQPAFGGGDYSQPQAFNPESYNQPPAGYEGYTGQEYATNPNDLVDEPLAPTGQGRATKSRQNTSQRRVGRGLAPIFGGMAGARRAAFGAENATGLDQVGRQRAERIRLPLVILGLLLLAAALILFFTIFIGGGRDQTASTDPQAAAATQTAGSAVPSVVVGGATTPGSVVTGPTAARATTPASPTLGSAVTVPVAGGATVAVAPTVASGQPTQAPPPPPAQTTAAPAQAQPSVTPAPGARPRPAVYTVASGDNLTRIASRFNTSIEAIRAANRTTITNDRIFAGNRLVIPVSRPDYRGPGGVILANNQNLQAIATQFNANLDELARFNGLANPADAKPGDAILIP